MNLYPAIQAQMGSWRYYTVKMSMSELADNVKFAADVYDDRTLDEAIQRVLNESRVKTDLVTYLIRQDDRFFSSVVVAALDGNPKWYPLSITDDERFSLFRDDDRLNEAFGMLAFDGSQHYYALDGQHRLAAIKALVDSNSDVSADAPVGFQDEEMCVIVVVPSHDESTNDFLTRYRRLFGNLNRYAKPTDAVTNIIMDEDDAFAILTRRLITEHIFFQYSGRQRDSARVKTTKGKALRSSDSYFTSLETLYAMNIKLLYSRERQNTWGVGDQKLNQFRKFRPDEEVLESLFEELVMYWDVLIEEIPVLNEFPSNMRNHGALEKEDDTTDNVLFWPIGQELFADLARDLLDLDQKNPSNLSKESISNSLRKLNYIDWNFHHVPWRNLLLIPVVDDDHIKWKVRNEDRKNVLDVAKQIVGWQLGLWTLRKEEIGSLRQLWENTLLPALDESETTSMWDTIEQNSLR